MENGADYFPNRSANGSASDAAVLKAGGRLRIPVLALAGAHSPLAAIAPVMIKDVAGRATVRPIPDAGHWIAEENPLAFPNTLGRFLRDNPA